MERCPAYISKLTRIVKNKYFFNDHKRRKRMLVLYFAVIKLSTLLKCITLKDDSDSYCLNCLHYLRTKDKLSLMKNFLAEFYYHLKRMIT